jgi:hypothetical protein
MGKTKSYPETNTSESSCSRTTVQCETLEGFKKNGHAIYPIISREINIEFEKDRDLRMSVLQSEI